MSRPSTLASTLAVALGVRLPWTTDGANVLDPTWSGRPAKTMLVAGGGICRMVGPADLRGAVMERVRHKLAIFERGDPLNAPAAGGRADLIGQRATDYPTAATDIEVTVDAPELLGAVDPVADFVPAQITGSARAPDGASPLLLAVALNGVVAAVTRPYPFSVFGRDGAWEERELRDDHPGDEDRSANRPKPAQAVLRSVIESRSQL